MKVFNFERKPCEQVRSYLDSYLNDELRVETNSEIQRHLESCRNCSAELEARVRLRKALRQAVESETAPVALQAKIREQIRASQPTPLFSLTRERLGIAAALVIVLCLGVWGAFSLWNRQAGEQLIQADLNPRLSEQARRILNIGLADHIHCAIEDEATRTYFGNIDPKYAGLLSPIKEKLGHTYKVVAAHHCEVEGREFVHFILQRGETILSLALTKKNEETFGDATHFAGGDAVQAPLHRGRLQNFEVIGFETNSHLAFVVSNLSEDENLRIASSVAPPVRDFLSKLEAIS